MDQKGADNTLKIRPGLWNPDYIPAKRSLLQRLMWQQIGMYFVLALLLLIVVLLCTKSSSPFVPVVFVATLIIATSALLRPDFALLLVFAASGLPSIIVGLPFHTMLLNEPALALCVMILFLRRPFIRFRLPHLLALLFLGIGIISFIHVPTFSTDPNAYAGDKQLYSVILFITAFLVGTFLMGYIKNISTFLVAVLLSNTPLYLIGLAQALGIHVVSFLEASGAQDPLQSGGRLWGPFDGAVSFAMYLVGLLSLALACWLLGTRRRDRVIGAVMTAATLLEIVGSGTRSVAIAAVVMVILACIVTRRFKLLLGVFVLSGAGLGIFLGKILTLFAHPISSTTNRLFLWQVALQLIRTHPWLGIGLEEFPTYYARLIVPQATQLDPSGISVHNQYLSWALSSGIAWPIVGVALLSSIICYCVKAYRSARGGEKALLLATILAVSAALIIGCFDVPLDKKEGIVNFPFLLSGIALGYVERIRRRKATEGVGHPGASVARVQAVSPTGLDAFLYRSTPPRASGHAHLPPPSKGSEAGEIDLQEEAPSVQKTGRSVILQVLSWGTSAVVIFPATALLTRYLGPIQYGEYSFTIPFLSISALLSGTGMDPLITRILSTQKRSEWSKTLSFAAGTRLITTLAMSAGAALIAFVLPVSTEQRILLLLGSGSLLFSFSFNGLRTVYECGFWAEQRFTVPALIEALDRVVTSGLIIVAILFRLSLPWTYILIVYSDLPFALILAFIARNRYHMRIRFSLAGIREYFVGSLALTVHNGLTQLTNQANLLLLLPLAGPLSVGLYALALRITSPLLSIAVVYVIALYPLLCKRLEEGRHRFAEVYNETARILALAVIPLAIFVSLEASHIVLLLGGGRFIAAATATRLLMWAVAATFFSQLAVRGCMAAKHDHSIPYVTGTSLAVNVLANLILIPHLQATGAAMAALLCQLVAVLLFSALLARHVNLLRTAGILLRVVLGNIPALAFLFWQGHASLLLVTPIFLSLVIIGCVATRALSLKDVAMARHILLERKGRMSPAKQTTANQTIAFVPGIEAVADRDQSPLP